MVGREDSAFWISQTKQKVFWILRCGIEGGFCVFLRVRFCEIVESGVDSAELQNRWLIKVGSEKGFYFLQKQKVAKTFRFCVCRIEGGFVRVRFYGIVESGVDSAELLQKFLSLK